MARMPGAQWRAGVNHFNRGRPVRVNLAIVHYTVSSLSGAENWLRNPASQVSYHFGVTRAGSIWQWVDTANTAWHAKQANGRSIGIGNEAGVGQSLTTAQLDANARIIRWAAGRYGPLTVRVAANASQAGVGWHRQHVATACPGDPIIRQVPTIVSRALGGNMSGPFRHVADGSFSLDQLVRRRSTTVNNIINVSFENMNRGNSAAFARYLAGPGRGAPMPRGLVFWTRNR